MTTLNRLEAFLLKFLKNEKARSWLTKSKNKINQYDNVLIQRELDTVLDKEIDKSKENKDFIAETILKNFQKSWRANVFSKTLTESDISRVKQNMEATVVLAPQFKKLSKIVGVQPLTGPVGMIYTLQYTVANMPVPETIPESAKTARLSLSVLGHAVEASSRRLRAAFAMEAVEDMKATNGVNVTSEMTRVIAQEVYQEYENFVVGRLQELAEKIETTPVDLVGGNDPRMFIVEFNKITSKIGFDTRRGHGNFFIMSKEIHDRISALIPTLTYTAPEIADTIADGGKLHGVQVYVKSNFPADKVLFGYKGTNGETDAGYFYCPYIPLMFEGPTVDVMTFSSVMHTIIRAGEYIPSETADDETPGYHNASNYYKLGDFKWLLNYSVEDLAKAREAYDATKVVDVAEGLFEEKPVEVTPKKVRKPRKKRPAIIVVE